MRSRIGTAALACAAMAVLSACGTTVPMARQLGADQQGDVGLSGGTVQHQTSTQDSGMTAPSGSGASTGGRVAPGQSSSSGVGRAAPAAGGPVSASQGSTARAGKVSGPISIGFISVNNDAASSAGVKDGRTFTPRQAFEALVRSYNRAGGIAGRRIVPTYVELKSSSNNYPQALQAACTQFVQDSRDVAVLGVLGLWSQTLNSCLAKSNVPYISGDYASGDAGGLQASPTFVDPAALTLDARLTALLTHLSESGDLAQKDRIGLVVEGCPESGRAADRTVLPLAKRLGLDIAKRVDSACFNGLSDFGSQASQMQNAVLGFQTAGVTKVVFVSVSAETNLFLLLSTAAESQGYRPGYALTSAAALGVQATNAPKAQLENVRAVGWLPSLDLGAGGGSPQSAACLKQLSAQSVNATSVLDRYFATTSCDALALYAKALKATRGNANGASVLGALRGLGTSFASAATLDAATDLGSAPGGGAAHGRRVVFGTSCGCFTYVGPTFALR